jgi:hypothetical protein
MSAAVAVFVKTPGLSPVKTRLAAGIGEARATEFHRLASLAVAETARLAGAAVYWAVAEQKGLADPLWAGHERLWQGDGELGARMSRVYRKLLGRHPEGVALLGGDSPQLAPSLVAGALRGAGRSYVLGPARDGGFYLFAGNRPLPQDIWESVAYGQADTGERFRRAAERFGPVALLEPSFDVDTADELALLASALDEGARARRLTVAQRELHRWLGYQAPPPPNVHGVMP